MKKLLMLVAVLALGAGFSSVAWAERPASSTASATACKWSHKAPCVNGVCSKCGETNCKPDVAHTCKGTLSNDKNPRCNKCKRFPF